MPQAVGEYFTPARSLFIQRARSRLSPTPRLPFKQQPRDSLLMSVRRESANQPQPPPPIPSLNATLPAAHTPGSGAGCSPPPLRASSLTPLLCTMSMRSHIHTTARCAAACVCLCVAVRCGRGQALSLLQGPGPRPSAHQREGGVPLGLRCLCDPCGGARWLTWPGSLRRSQMFSLMRRVE